MRTLTSNTQWAWRNLLFLLVSVMFLSSCRVAEPRGFFADLSRTDAEVRVFPLDDLLVWPIQSQEAKLIPYLDAMTREIRRGLIQSQYSVLSHRKAVELAKSLGKGRTEALEALRRLKGDGVLVISVDTWDERGLESLGRVRCQGKFVLLSPEGNVLWQGRFRNNGVLVDRDSGVFSLEDLRLEAAKNLARMLTKKFPPHRIR